MRRSTLRLVKLEYLIRLAEWLNKRAPNRPPIQTKDISKNELVSAVHLRILLGI